MIYPTDWRDLKADSLPDPGPEISTLNVLRPYSFALVPTSSAAIWAANGVDFLEPLKPLCPAEDHARAFPFSSVIVMIVLLKEETTCAIPLVTFLFILVLSFYFFLLIII